MINTCKCRLSSCNSLFEVAALLLILHSHLIGHLPKVAHCTTLRGIFHNIGYDSLINVATEIFPAPKPAIFLDHLHLGTQVDISPDPWGSPRSLTQDDPFPKNGLCLSGGMEGERKGKRMKGADCMTWYKQRLLGGGTSCGWESRVQEVPTDPEALGGTSQTLRY